MVQAYASSDWLTSFRSLYSELGVDLIWNTFRIIQTTNCIVSACHHHLSLSLALEINMTLGPQELIEFKRLEQKTKDKKYQKIHK